MGGHRIDEIRKEFQAGIQDENHPFRSCALATVSIDRLARLRTVIIREVGDELNFRFFTDRRSKKILHIKENNKVSMLFYHHEKKLQIKVEGLAEISKDTALLSRIWGGLPEEARKNYTSTLAPGSSLEDPEELTYGQSSENFSMVEVQPFKIEYVNLSPTPHLRIRYTRKADQWQEEFLVP